MNHIELPEAELRPLLDFEGYWAGADGKIYSMRMSRGREYRPLKPGLGSTGYQHVNLPVEDGIYRPRLVHMLVAEAFHGARPEGVEVSHQRRRGPEEHASLRRFRLPGRDSDPHHGRWNEQVHRRGVRRLADNNQQDSERKKIPE